MSSITFSYNLRRIRRQAWMAVAIGFFAQVITQPWPL